MNVIGTNRNNEPNIVKPTSSKRRSYGFSLLEVLIAFVILAVGLLGLAAMQTTSFRLNHQSYQRTQATIMIYEIIDRVRANSTGDYELTITSTPPTVSTDCNAGTCTADEIAIFDRNHWIGSISNNLSDGQGSIALVGGSTNRFLFTITWVEHGVTKTQTMETEI